MAKQKLALVEAAKKKNKKEKTSSLASVAKTVTQATASAAKGKVVTPSKTTTPRKEIRSTGNVSNSIPMKRNTSSNFTNKSTIKTNDLVSKKSWYNKDKNQSGTMTKKADIYKRGNKYYFDKDGEETEVSKDLINRAKKGQKIIGHYEDDGSYTYIDDRKKDKNLLHKAKYVGKSAGVGVSTGVTGIADAGLQEAEESLKEGKKKKSTMDKIAQVAEIFNTIQNPQQGIVKGVKSHLKNLKGIWKDKDKSTKDKIIESAVSGVSSAKHATPGYDQAKETLELVGSVFNNADEKVKKARETIDKPIQKMQQNLQEEGELYDGATRFVGQGLNIVGNMAPSIAATAITRNPNIGLGAMGISAKGNATKEAMQQGASLEDAIKIGDAKGALEVGTEKLSGGAKLFGKGNLDDVIEETIKKKVGNKAMRKALLVGEGILGEQAEELVSDVVGWQIDKGTFNPDAKYDLDDIKETLAQTGFTTLLLNGLTGGFTPKLNNNQNQNNVNVAKDLQTKATQSAEIEQKVQNGEITPAEGTELIKQVQDGTYEKNQNLQAIANNAKQTIVQRLNSGEISQEQATQEMNTITNALAKQQSEINNYTVNMDNQAVKNINTMLERRNINIEYDNSKFDNNETVAYWKKDAEGNRSITINPNASADQVVESIAIHELTHDLLSSENSRETLQIQELLDYVSQIDGYAEARANLEQIYAKDYDVNSSEFKELVDEEVVADVLGTQLGNQEYVSRLVGEKPNLAKRIYDWVLDKLDNIGKSAEYRQEKAYWQKMANNFEKAYNMEYQNTNQIDKRLIKDKTTTTDNEGNKLSEGQIKYFYNSKVRDEIGNLIKVFHTTTNPIIQFNEFNPTGTRGYNKKFGNQIVNYYTDSKFMSGSYADQKYEMADTERLNTIEDAQQWLDSIGVGDLTIEGNEVYEDSIDTVLKYKSTKELLRNIKSDIQSEYGNEVPIQYEGYLDIKNPFVVEVGGKSWNEISKELNSNIPQEIEKAESKKAELYKLVEDSKYKNEIYYGNKQIVVKNADKIFSNTTNDNLKELYNDGFIGLNSNYNDFYDKAEENGYDVPAPNTKMRDIIDEETASKITKKEMLDWTIDDCYKKLHEFSEQSKDYGSESSWFYKNYKKIIGDNIKSYYLTDNDWWDLASNKFDSLSKDRVASGDIETNDVVAYIIAENRTKPKNEQYDGVIFKDVIDYVGKEYYENGSPPADVYVTFNSNQFKAADNLQPTKDADIRYSQEAKKWQKFLDDYFKTNGSTTKLGDVRSNEGTNETQQNDGTTPKVLDKVPQEEQKKRTLREEFQWAKRKFVDKGEAVYRLAKERKNKSLYHKFDRMGISEGESQSQIGIAQTDLNGKKYTNFINKKGKPTSMSVDGLFNDFKGPKDVLNQYLVHQLNLDRLGQGIEQFQNITGESSAEFIKKAEAEYPDIKRVAQNIYQYNYNQLDKMVDAGLITEAQANEFKTKTPHYVRIQRHILKNGKPVQETQYNVSLNNQIQKVEGSAADIMPIKETMAQYTKDVTQAIRRNIFANELANTLETETNSNEVALGEDLEINPNLLNEDGKGNYTFTYFKDGQAKTVPVDKAIFESLKPNEKYEWENYGVPRLMGKISSIQRTLLTDKNPLFLATNFFKDIGDAPLNSKYGMAQFYKNYVRAIKDQTSIGKFTQLYRSLGGNQNTYFEQGKFTEFSGNKVKRAGQTALHSIEKANNYIEQLPRITEFMTTIEQNGYTINENGDLVARKGKNPKKSVGDVLNEAMYNAAEITTNFKRGGNYAKALNRNGATFFNASVQGFSKQIRNFTEIDSPKAATRLMAKAVILGIGPEILNQAMHGGDDDYEELSDYIKDGYYLFKSKDGKWIRIPKGRAVSIFLSATRRTGETIRGEKNLAEAFKGFGGFASNQIAPNNVAESNVLSPVIGAATNKSWSGNKIVPDSLANRNVSEQYNEKTDEFSKWVGKQLNISPMKVNYILDQYSGVVGDIGLPLITPKSKTGTKNPVKSAIISKFTADSVNDNKSVSVFFDTKKKIEGGIDSANQMSKQALQEKYMRTKNGEMAELYTKQREIQSNPNLSTKEKFEQAREIQKDINAVAKEAVKDVNNVDKKDNYAEIGDDIYYKASKDGKNYWKKESDKTKAKRDELGLPISDFYYYKIEEAYTKPNGSRVDITSGKHAKEDISLVKAFDMDTSDYLKYSSEIGSIRGDKRSNGATIRGSAKRKKMEYINSLPISATQKYLLYSLKVDQRKRKRTNQSVIDTINNSNLSRSEKQELYNYIYK